MLGYVVRVDRWLMRCYDAEIPMGVLGTPEEVAETVVWMYVFSLPSVVTESGCIDMCLAFGLCTCSTVAD